MTVTISEGLRKREKQVSNYIEEYSTLAKIDPNLVRALITQESRFVAEAVSPTNAYGYGQFTNIGARQVQQIATIHNSLDFGDLMNFQKKEASDPDRGIKAICAYLWWLLYVKYKNVQDKKVQLEAVLTFYNAGGRPAYLVVKHGGFSEAVPFIKELPAHQRGQAHNYAGEVSLWYVAWHELMKQEEKIKVNLETSITENPFNGEAFRNKSLDHRYKALVEALKLLQEDDNISVLLTSRDGFTEVVLLLPGEYEHASN